ncbi:MAG: hypothetical protein IKC59_01865, partial [Clostridia bacterium]|nr:hypothetical protein [Clostridia bacterium]
SLVVWLDFSNFPCYNVEKQNCACMFRAFYSDLNKASREEFEIMERKGPEPWAGACVSDERGVGLAIANGATLITCNNPDVILDLLRRKGYHQ